ncbi:MAG: hypothetical protein Q4C95_07380, partial [Planctomycetia bacterium]|nr:hypothetical protein [Planctomycetia bacterium]
EDSAAPTPPAPVVPESNNPAPVLEDSAAPTPPASTSALVIPSSNKMFDSDSAFVTLNKGHSTISKKPKTSLQNLFALNSKNFLLLLSGSILIADVPVAQINESQQDDSQQTVLSNEQVKTVDEILSKVDDSNEQEQIVDLQQTESPQTDSSVIQPDESNSSAASFDNSNIISTDLSSNLEANSVTSSENNIANPDNANEKTETFEVYPTLFGDLSENVSTDITSANNSNSSSFHSAPTQIAPGVYIVVNEDGTLTITSSDAEALEEFQQKLIDAVQKIKTGRKSEDALNSELTQTVIPDSISDENISSSNIQFNQISTDQNNIIEAVPNVLLMKSNDSNRAELLEKNLWFQAKEYREAAKERLVMETRTFSVYQVKEVSVTMVLPRLQTFMADRINPPQSALTPSPQALARGVRFQTINPGPRMTLTQDPIMNTITVYGSKTDRDETGAMIVLLDRPELFPQPISKPTKVKVKNISVVKMNQLVLQTFSRKLMMTQLPGGMSPRISPNTDTDMLEIYAPKELAEEIVEYVKETDEDVVKDPIRQVRIIQLNDINSNVLQSYLSNFQRSGNYMNYNNYYNPYMMNPYMNYNMNRNRLTGRGF